MLELGCGTGRVLLPLAEVCGYIHGLDISEAMVAVCREKLQAAGMVGTKAQVEVEDITNFALGRTFDLIFAPYRVLQNLEPDIEDRARTLHAEGIKPLDALHLASAVEAKADYFCTCDDRFLKRAKAVDTGQTKVVSPLELITEVTQ